MRKGHSNGWKVMILGQHAPNPPEYLRQSKCMRVHMPFFHAKQIFIFTLVAKKILVIYFAKNK